LLENVIKIFKKSCYYN